MIMYGYLLETDNLNTALIIMFLGMALKLAAHIPFLKFDNNTNTKESVTVETK